MQRILFMSFAAVLTLLPKTFGFQTLKALSVNQQEYLDAIRNDTFKVVFGLGCAGTGKTYLACKAASLTSVPRIILTKPLVSVNNEEIGFLPGSMRQKVSPWAQNILEYLTENSNKKSRVQIEFLPLGYMRGHTFTDTTIIADEMQNSSPDQMLMLLTRLGANSKLIITGDLMQKDIRSTSGIEDFLDRHLKTPLTSVKIVYLESEDVFRDKFTKDVLKLYQKQQGQTLTTASATQTTLSSKYLLTTSLLSSSTREGNCDAAMIPKSQLL